MAKSKPTPEEELMNMDGSTILGETNVNENEEKNAVTERAAEEVRVVEGKKVSIQVVEPVDCIIAGEHYLLSKDRGYKVPTDVAAILVNSKKAYRV